MPFSISRARRSLLSARRLWILAAALGIVTVYVTMTIIHDTSQRRRAVYTLVQSIADQVSAGLSDRASLVVARARGALPADTTLLRDSVFVPYSHDAYA